jgi:UrcA family protein
VRRQKTSKQTTQQLEQRPPNEPEPQRRGFLFSCVTARTTSETFNAGFEINASSLKLMLPAYWRQFRSPDIDRRSDMTRSIFGLPLMIAFAAASAMAAAQQKDEAPEIRLHTGKVQVTTLDSDDGIPTEQFGVQRVVSYANLDLSTAAGAAELKRRVSEAAKQACRELVDADPIDLADDDGNLTCVRQTTDGAMQQMNAAIATARIDTVRPTKVSRN